MADKWLVETGWLAERLGLPGLVVLDGSWHLPTAKRNAYEEYLQEHIPGALFFDIDEISDTSNPLPHMLPSPEKFASRMRSMGIGDGMQIVIYDSYGMFSAARVWWTFRVMGTESVHVLNGGLRKWKQEGRPLEDGPPPRRGQRHFTVRSNLELVRDRDEIAAFSANGGAQIVDARSAARFAGKAPEPRPGLRSGRIPGSLNVPFTELLQEDGSFKPVVEMRKVFEAAGVDVGKPIVNTCGSGVTASILSLALAMMGHRNAAVYDGSWSEWGADASLPIEPKG
ncbi:MAG: 3-mercaptopyruvate sulfurtransferase [Pseudomonadota bacterium]|nr:3-mercaptopyruvate sulfurtransferase [Pseudomonadota bacterium]